METMVLPDKTDGFVSKVFCEPCQTSKPSYFMYLFNFLYYMCICPFKIEKDRNTDKYVINRFKLQNFVSLLVTLFSISIGFGFIGYRVSGVNFLDGDVSRLMDLIGNIACALSLLYMVVILWLKQASILQFVNASTDAGPLITGLSVERNGLLMFIFSTYHYINHLLVCYQLTPFGMMTEEYWNMLGVSFSKDMNPLCEWSLRVVMGFFVLQGNWVFSVSRMIVMVLALTLKSMKNQLIRTLADENIEVKHVVREYTLHKSKMDMASDWTGWLVLFHYVGFLAFLANIPKRPAEGYAIYNYYLVYTYVLYGAFIILACNATNGINCAWRTYMVRKRLQDKLDVENRLLMASLTHEIETDPIGLSCTFFTITYDLFGSMIGLVATYGILVYQLNKA